MDKAKINLQFVDVDDTSIDYKYKIIWETNSFLNYNGKKGKSCLS